MAMVMEKVICANGWTMEMGRIGKDDFGRELAIEISPWGRLNLYHLSSDNDPKGLGSFGQDAPVDIKIGGVRYTRLRRRGGIRVGVVRPGEPGRTYDEAVLETELPKWKGGNKLMVYSYSFGEHQRIVPISA